MRLTPEMIWEMAKNVAAHVVANEKDVMAMSRDELAAIDSRCENLIVNPSQFDGKDYDETEELDYFKTLVRFHVGQKVKAAREFSLQVGDDNSIFVWSSPFAKNFKEMPDVEEGMTVVITNAHNPSVHIYDTRGFSERDIQRVVEEHCRYVTRGCNYSYELIKKIGNCYFVN